MNKLTILFVHFLARAKKTNQKKAPVSLRVPLRFGAAVGRAETPPSCDGVKQSPHLIAHSPAARPRDNGEWPR
jgi:hypothetical protein